MRLFIYFIDKTDIYLYDNDKGNNKNIIFFLGELYRTIIGLDKDTIVSEENISSSIKQFLKDIESCFNTSIYEKTMVNLEKLVNTKYNVYNEDFKKMIKIALEEIKNDKINNK